MMARRRSWLAAALLAPWARRGVAAPPPAGSVPKRDPWPRGRAAPKTALARLDGTPWTPADERGSALLLNFWASWCEPCRDEMPSLQRLSDELQPRGLRVLAVNYRESAATISQYVDGAGLRLPVLRDAEGGTARAFGVGIFPTTVALDRAGRPAFSVVGQADWSAGPARGWALSLLGA